MFNDKSKKLAPKCILRTQRYVKKVIEFCIAKITLKLKKIGQIIIKWEPL